MSRIDFEVTVLNELPSTAFLEGLERSALNYTSTHDSRKQVELRRNNKTGKTLYLGSRYSDRFIRIYDKGKQSKLPELNNFWRAEVEFHRGLAFSQARTLSSYPDEAKYVSVTVNRELSRVGIAWFPISSEPQRVPQALNPQRTQSTNEARKAWLRTQVAPTIKKLRKQTSRTELLELLGLAEDQEREQ